MTQIEGLSQLETNIQQTIKIVRANHDLWDQGFGVMRLTGLPGLKRRASKHNLLGFIDGVSKNIVAAQQLTKEKVYKPFRQDAKFIIDLLTKLVEIDKRFNSAHDHASSAWVHANNKGARDIEKALHDLVLVSQDVGLLARDVPKFMEAFDKIQADFKQFKRTLAKEK